MLLLGWYDATVVRVLSAATAQVKELEINKVCFHGELHAADMPRRQGNMKLIMMIYRLLRSKYSIAIITGEDSKNYMH